MLSPDVSDGRPPDFDEIGSSRFSISACGRVFPIRCDGAEVISLIKTGFGAMLGERSVASAEHIKYHIGRIATGFTVASEGGMSQLGSADELLFHLDKGLTIALQQQRPDLLFLHGAVVASDGRAAVVSAPSGTGKSTLTLAMLERGFDYLSDELAPIDVERGFVYGYPHALCLKSPPPVPCHLPATTFNAGRRWYVPADSLHVTVRGDTLPLAAFFFIQRRGASPTRANRITPAAATAHLMSNALNALAHPGAGMDAALSLGKRIPAFELDSTDLSAACDQIKNVLDAG